MRRRPARALSARSLPSVEAVGVANRLRLVHASLLAVSGQQHAACETLERASHRLRAYQALGLALYAERQLADLRADADALRQIDATLQGNGVRDSARWVAAHFPFVPAGAQRVSSSTTPVARTLKRHSGNM